MTTTQTNDLQRYGAWFDVRVLDAGHRYELGSLDGEHHQTLQFVKRCDLERPWRYPGNTNSHPGATIQIVIRALLDRVSYLQGQIWCLENWIITKMLQLSLWLLEIRAARRHGLTYWHGLRFAAQAPICGTCGHTTCEHGCSCPKCHKQGVFIRERPFHDGSGKVFMCSTDGCENHRLYFYPAKRETRTSG